MQKWGVYFNSVAVALALLSAGHHPAPQAAEPQASFGESEVQKQKTVVEKLTTRVEALETELAKWEAWNGEAANRDYEDQVLKPILKGLPGEGGCNACKDCVIKAENSNYDFEDPAVLEKLKEAQKSATPLTCPVVYEILENRSDLKTNGPLAACVKPMMVCRTVRQAEIVRLAKAREKDVRHDLENAKEDLDQEKKRLDLYTASCAECNPFTTVMTPYGAMQVRKPTVMEGIISGIQIATPAIQSVMGLIGTQMSIDSYNTIYNKYFDECKAVATMPCAPPALWANGGIVAGFGAGNMGFGGWGGGGVGALGNPFGQMGGQLALGTGLFGQPVAPQQPFFGMGGGGFSPWSQFMGGGGGNPFSGGIFGGVNFGGGSPFGFPGQMGGIGGGGAFPFFGGGGAGGGWGGGPFGAFNPAGGGGGFGSFGAPFGNYFGGPNAFGFPGMGNGGVFGGLGGAGGLGTLGSFDPSQSAQFQAQYQASLAAQFQEQQLRYSKQMEAQKSMAMAYQQYLDAQSRMAQVFQGAQQIGATGGISFR